LTSSVKAAEENAAGEGARADTAETELKAAAEAAEDAAAKAAAEIQALTGEVALTPILKLKTVERWEGCRESRRCSRDTYPESYISPSILVYEEY